MNLFEGGRNEEFDMNHGPGGLARKTELKSLKMRIPQNWCQCGQHDSRPFP